MGERNMWGRILVVASQMTGATCHLALRVLTETREVEPALRLLVFVETGEGACEYLRGDRLGFGLLILDVGAFTEDQVRLITGCAGQLASPPVQLTIGEGGDVTVASVAAELRKAWGDGVG